MNRSRGSQAASMGVVPNATATSLTSVWRRSPLRCDVWSVRSVAKSASGDRANPRPEVALHSRCSTQAVESEPDLLFSAGLMERVVNGEYETAVPGLASE